MRIIESRCHGLQLPGRVRELGKDNRPTRNVFGPTSRVAGLLISKVVAVHRTGDIAAAVAIFHVEIPPLAHHATLVRNRGDWIDVADIYHVVLTKA